MSSVRVRQLLLGLCTIVALAIAWNQPSSILRLWALDITDPRPRRTILIIGNSRVYGNDMPGMLRKIADSAKDDHKFDITVAAYAGASLENLDGDPGVRKLLSQTWDEVIVQAESRAHSNDELRRSFMKFGTHLLRSAKVVGGVPKLVVNWGYSKELYPMTSDPNFRSQYFHGIQQDHAALASRGGASLVNVGRVWEVLLNARPDIRLYTDGNHPSSTGSYLQALMIYRSLSPANFTRVTFVPADVTAEVATELGRAVQND